MRYIATFINKKVQLRESLKGFYTMPKRHLNVDILYTVIKRFQTRSIINAPFIFKKRKLTAIILFGK